MREIKQKEDSVFLVTRKRSASINFSEPKGEALEKIVGFVGISRLTLEKAEDIVEETEQEPEKYQPLLDKQNKIKNNFIS